MIRGQQLIKVMTLQGKIRYVNTETTRNGLNRVYDEQYQPVSMCMLNQALMVGIFKEIN